MAGCRDSNDAGSRQWEGMVWAAGMELEAAGPHSIQGVQEGGLPAGKGLVADVAHWDATEKLELTVAAVVGIAEAVALAL